MPINESQYIKSTSNYVIKKKHQSTNKGDIYERDITTVGGRNYIDANNRPVYKSGDFIITASNEQTTPRAPIDTVWDKTPDNEEEWTWDDIKDENEEVVDASNSIELNPDVFDLRTFAYFGSCSELIRGSLNHIITTFPGELYATSQTLEFTKTEVEEGVDGMGNTYVKKNEVNRILGASYTEQTVYDNVFDVEFKKVVVNTDEKKQRICLVDNPFKINFHTQFVEDFYVEQEPLKYALVDGFYKENYDFIDKDGNVYDIVDVKYEENENVTHVKKKTRKIRTTHIVSGEKVEYEILENSKCQPKPTDENENIEDYENCDCVKPFEKMGTLTITVDRNESREIFIDVYKLEGDDYAYLTDGEIDTNNYGEIEVKLDNEWHIRPKTIHYTNFRRHLSLFEKTLLSENTMPKYSPNFEVYKETDYGFAVEMQQFSFPLDSGGYNLGINLIGYTQYVERLASIADQYDEWFCDNLYRSMTHEAIKNFDWSFQRNKNSDLEDLYYDGGSKVQKIIRLIGREFDEFKLYIDGITQANKLTYDGNDCLPDYLLTDYVENEGWNYNHIIPFIKKEINDGDSKSENKYSFPEYSGSVTPYLYEPETDDCDDKPYFITKIKTFTSDRVYSANEINNMFARVLSLCSRSIWKKKGTVAAIDSLLSLFGFKNKRWVKALCECRDRFEPNDSCPDPDPDSYKENYVYNKGIDCDKREEYSTVDENDWDYEIKEYSYHNINKFLSKRERDKYVNINFLKKISYSEEVNVDDDPTPWRGLLVREKEVNQNDSGYMIYPYFDKNGENDGEPWYQMYGGWLNKQKSIGENDEPINNSYFTETLSKVRGVRDIKELLELPPHVLYDEYVCYVSDMTKKYILIDGIAYELKPVYDVNNKLSDKWGYFSAVVRNGTVVVGTRVYSKILNIIEPGEAKYSLPNTDNTKYYSMLSEAAKELDDSNSDDIVVDFEVEKVAKPIETYRDNTAVNIYVRYDVGASGNKVEFVLSDANGTRAYNVQLVTAEDLGFTVDNKPIECSKLKDCGESDEKPITGTTATSYFILNNVDFRKQIKFLSSDPDVTSLGWNQLSEESEVYKRVRAIVDEYEGNNPHTHKNPYDLGKEYIDYFSHWFKFASKNDLFLWDRIYDIMPDNFELEENIYDLGFERLWNEKECTVVEPDEDNKIWDTEKINYIFPTRFVYNTETYEKIDENQEPIQLCEPLVEGKEYYVFLNDKLYENVICSGNSLTIKKDENTELLKLQADETKITGFQVNELNSVPEGEQKSILFSIFYPKANGDSYIIITGNDEEKTDYIIDCNSTINTKLVEINFNLKNDKYNEKLKYIDKVVIPYLSQVISSTIIVKITYFNGTD